MVNIRQKGQSGEREVAKIMNKIVAKVRRDLGLPQYALIDELFQRNQNQSAVGGSDLSCPMPLEIEIKRQEQLSINTWWKQCVASAARTNGIPILIFRQSRQKWRIMMNANLVVTDSVTIGPLRAEIDLPTFEFWFKNYYENWVNDNA